MVYPLEMPKMKPMPTLESEWDPSRDSMKDLFLRRNFDRALAQCREIRKQEQEGEF